MIYSWNSFEQLGSLGRSLKESCKYTDIKVMKKQGQSLDKIVDRTSELKQVRKDEVHFGDLVDLFFMEFRDESFPDLFPVNRYELIYGHYRRLIPAIVYQFPVRDEQVG